MSHRYGMARPSDDGGALDDDSIAFGKIRSVAAAIAGMADSIQSLAYMVQDETEGRERQCGA